MSKAELAVDQLKQDSTDIPSMSMSMNTPMFYKKPFELAPGLPLNKTPGPEYWDRLFELSDGELKKALEINEHLSETQKRDLFRKFVCIVAIETSTYCNRSCDYCPIALPQYGRKKKNYMPDSVWESIVSNLADIEYASTISLNLYNEVLADKSLIDKIEQLRERVPDSFIKFNTNGDFLNKNMLNTLEQAGLDAIFISLHPDKNGVYEDGDRLKAVYRFFDRIGYSGGIDEIVPNQRIRADCHFGRTRVLVMCDNWNDYGTDRSGIIPHLSIEERDEPCWRPLREFTISHNGNVFPCCQLFPDEPANFKYKLGNVGEETIFDIYAKATAAQWRKGLFDYSKKSGPCATCSDPCFGSVSSADRRASIVNSLCASGDLTS